MQRAFPLALAVLVAPVAPVAMSAAVYAQSPIISAERAHAMHVLNRLAFGPRPGDVEGVLAMGVDRWIEQQLNPAAMQDPSLPSLLPCQLWTTPFADLDKVTYTIEMKSAGLPVRFDEGDDDEHARLRLRRVHPRPAEHAWSRIGGVRSGSSHGGLPDDETGEERAAAARGDDRLLAEPLLCHLCRLPVSLVFRAVRPRHDPSECTGSFSRSAGRGGAQPCHARVSEQRREWSARQRAFPRRIRARQGTRYHSAHGAERELRARAARAAHAGRRWRLYAGRCHCRRARIQRLVAHRLGLRLRRSAATRCAFDMPPAPGERARISCSIRRSTMPAARSYSVTRSRQGAASRTATRCADLLARHPSTARFIARQARRPLHQRCTAAIHHRSCGRHVHAH